MLIERSWSFDRWLICLQVFDGCTSISEVHKEEFWIQVYDMPFGCMTQEVGSQIGSNAVRVLQVHTNLRGIKWGKFLRIRVEMDIKKTLLRGMFITVEGKRS